MKAADPILMLQEFGFSEIEARIYCFLLTEPSSTGYRVAQGTGKPAANTYKALETLTQKGAALLEHGEPRRYRAVPPRDLFDALDRRFTDRRNAAEQALAAMTTPPTDQHVYQLVTPDQVYAIARRLLNEAREVALLDVFPEPRRRLQPELAGAVARGVRVALQIYADAPPLDDGARQLLSPAAERVAREWPGQQLNLVVDAREHLLALLDSTGESVHQAVWSNAAYLSCLQHSQMAAELVASDLRSGGDGSLSSRLSLIETAPPGFRALLESFGPSLPRSAP